MVTITLDTRVCVKDGFPLEIFYPLTPYIQMYVHRAYMVLPEGREAVQSLECISFQHWRVYLHAHVHVLSVS